VEDGEMEEVEAGGGGIPNCKRIWTESELMRIDCDWMPIDFGWMRIWLLLVDQHKIIPWIIYIQFGAICPEAIYQSINIILPYQIYTNLVLFLYVNINIDKM
jgi:hypothetical protein